jgi:hypothetical protein
VLDTSVGGDGIVTLANWDLPGLQGYSRLRPHADGNTIVTGSALSGGPDGCRVHVISLEPNGSWGPTYCAPPDAFPAEVYGIDSAVAPNGHVVSIAGTDDFHIVDFMPDGTVASVVTVPFNLGGANMDLPKAVATTTDGRIVTVGIAETSPTGPIYTSAAMAMLHWNTQGDLVLDPGFAGDGKLSFDLGGRSHNELWDVVAQGDGRIIVAGRARYFGSPYNWGMAVARLLSDGSFDGDFQPSAPGWRIVDFDVAPPAHDRAYRVALQNGRVVLAGTVDIANDIRSAGVARLLNSYVFADGFEAPQAPGWLWVD